MNVVYTLDIAHPPCSGEEAEQLLAESLRTVRSSSRYRILKIVHGYGSGGKGGTLKVLVQNWLYRNKEKFQSAIDGAQLNQMNHEVQRLCIECNLTATREFFSPNNGITIVWVK